MARTCEVCGDPTQKGCTGCTRVAYCSSACQNEHWPLHVVQCDNPGRPITTGDHFVAYHMGAELHSQSMMDYGFLRINDPMEMPLLIDIYVKLIFDLGVRGPTLHKWRTTGTLHAEIVAKFEAAKILAPMEFQWLVQNPQIFVAKAPPGRPTFLKSVDNEDAEMQRRTWVRVGGSATDSTADITRIQKSWSKDRKICFKFFTEVLGTGIPSERSADSCVPFACCLYSVKFPETLCILYYTLIQRCSFDEFCEAYTTSSLIALMDRKGLYQERSVMGPDFETVLSQSPRRISSVWYLRAYAHCQDAVPDLRHLVPYGFGNTQDLKEMERLRLFYCKLFKAELIPSLELLEAANGGRLFERIMKIPNLNASKSDRRFLKRVMDTKQPRATVRETTYRN